MAESIASRNIFDLLQDDAPDAEVSFNIRPVVEKKPQAATKTAAQADKKKAPSTEQRPKTTQRREGNRDGAPRAPRDRAPRDGAPRDRAPRDRAPRDGAPRDRAPRDGAPRERRPRDFTPRDAGDNADSAKPRHHHQSNDPPRGRARDAEYSSGSRRTYDRHSGTGVEDSEKKIKQGWMGDDMKVVSDEKAATEEAHADATEDASAPVVEAVAEPEDTTKTLEEYLKEKLESSTLKDVEKKEVREINVGVDSSLLKSSHALEKKEELFYVGKAPVKSKKQPKNKREKTQIDFEPRFAPLERQRRNNREDRDRDFGRNRRNHGPSLNVNDESAFPSLG
ncbi:hypothetical protein AYI68_g6150 [Smittium mucronatum]|uniref:Hyaluronan/mRNA-binding protein domain-containing protein n=1 Tax=Smittium mucronatum TaxID=133383 RepID=A0A1R0GS93_9FUNG|nr:hypothetical protein AYI68_g6150 [Smittium mucronatum]